MDGDEDYLDWSDDDIPCTSKYVVSSDEDEDLLVIPEGRNIAKKGCGVRGKQVGRGQDDFEREMASELSMTMQHLASAFAKNKAQGTSSSELTEDSEEKANKVEDTKFYDDVYFDSDDSDPEGSEPSSQPSGRKKKKVRHRVMTNDELLYDPTLDDQDQEWVNRQRRSYQVKQKRYMKAADSEGGDKSSFLPPLPPSDAVLNCPACLTTLCMDCQRHEIYHNQYRAMFVFNCTVDMVESLRFPCKNQKKKEYFRNKKKNKGQRGQETYQSQEAGIFTQEGADSGGAQGDQPPALCDESVASPSAVDSNASSFTGGGIDDVYHPVMCKICKTKVAVYDKDEVYHFFNVVTSY